MVTAKKIRDTRELAGWSIEKCAEAIEQPRFSWFQWEKGLQKMPDHFWRVWLTLASPDIEKSVYKPVVPATKEGDYAAATACLRVVSDICDRYMIEKGAPHYISQLMAIFRTPRGVSGYEELLTLCNARSAESSAEASYIQGALEDMGFSDISGLETHPERWGEFEKNIYLATGRRLK